MSRRRPSNFVTASRPSRLSRLDLPSRPLKVPLRLSGFRLSGSRPRFSHRFSIPLPDSPLGEASLDPFNISR